MNRILKISSFLILLFIVFFGISAFYHDSNNLKQTENSRVLKQVNKPIVYMTENITSDGLLAIHKALERKFTGKVAVKISTGEPGGENYLSPDLIKELIHSLNGTIVECNTAYKGKRSSTEQHKKVAEEHGFTAIANVDIMDEEGLTEISGCAEIVLEKGYDL